MRLLRLPDFSAWLGELNAKSQAQVEARLLRVRDHGHFGDHRYLGDGLAELRWKNGWRVYFARVEVSGGDAVLLILGGSKNGQQKDIRKARTILQHYAASED